MSDQKHNRKHIFCDGLYQEPLTHRVLVTIIVLLVVMGIAQWIF